jgi:signal recognition particle receptor subunit beta
MSVVDYAAREVRFRFTVMGPPGAGKATVLRCVHGGAEPSLRGEFSERPIAGGQLVRFDFSPIEILPIADHRARVEFLTLSGQVAETAHGARLLAETDVLLFIADSQPSRMDENRALLCEIAAQPSLADVPVVFLYNKRDVPDVATVAEMEGLLNPLGAPAFETVANKGEGLTPALAALCALALT